MESNHYFDNQIEIKPVKQPGNWLRRQLAVVRSKRYKEILELSRQCEARKSLTLQG